MGLTSVASNHTSSWLCSPQPRLKTGGLVILLALANAICPFAIDMYTPAVPSMPAYFATTEAMVNLTIVGFYLFYSLGMLVFGPVCDRTGRKPIMVGGMLTFALASFACAQAWSIETLIAFRIVQAIGAGAICAVSTAIIKDAFVPERRTLLLSVLQVLMVVGPVAAPLLGGVLLQFYTWHACFYALGILGALCAALAVLFTETLKPSERVHGNLVTALTRMGSVATNRSFALLLLVMALFSVPYMAYVAVASYVYVDFFGTTAQVYSYFFAATAAISICGPFVYLIASRRVSKRAFTTTALLCALLMGGALLVSGAASVWLFFPLFAAFALIEAAIRPYMTDALLSQNESDAGSASSLINFTVNIFGVLGMGLITPWNGSYIAGLGAIMFGSMLVGLLLWCWLLHSKTTRLTGFDRATV